MRDLAGRPVVLALAALLLAPPSLAKEDKRVFVRTEVESTNSDPIRVLLVQDVTRVDKSEVRSVQLWAAGSGFRFLVLTHVAAPTSWSQSLIGPKERQVVTFKKDPENPLLTPEELARGTGVLRVGDRELVLNRDDAGAPAVSARVEKLLLDVFDPEELSAIRAAVDLVRRCSVRIPSGNLLPVVAPSAHRRDGRSCSTVFRDVPADERDRKWELWYVTREPLVAEFLKEGAGIAKGVAK